MYLLPSFSSDLRNFDPEPKSGGSAPAPRDEAFQPQCFARWMLVPGRKGGSGSRRERNGLRSNRTGFPAVVRLAAKLRLPAAVAYANDLQLHKFNLPFESA
ncbi:hypothetical protein [Agrobacterium sp. GD03642]|uniref:hypothetical protein n=1 Tax=Agrobacterium sp. GD03642 TaxID=2975356 RepID=UPI00244BF205|nr:hypothetical protein [Agrobacterium sp. GD03642]MDH2226097.1 hypothetical protein [Agrobacterium sp. GD03642]